MTTQPEADSTFPQRSRNVTTTNPSGTLRLEGDILATRGRPVWLPSAPANRVELVCLRRLNHAAEA
jgi:hypothetical protein